MPSHLGAYVLLSAQFFGNCFIAFTGLTRFKKGKVIKILSYREIKSVAWAYLVRGIAFLPSLISAWVLQISNRWIIANQCDLRDVAFYSLSDYVYVLFSTCLLLPLGATYVPKVLEKFSQVQEPQDYRAIEKANLKCMFFYMCTLLIAAVIFYKPAELVFRMIVPELYSRCLPFMYMRFIGLIFFLGTYFTTCFIQFKRRARFLIWSLVATASLNVLLAFPLSKYYGVMGALIALGIAQCFYFVLTAWYNRNLHNSAAIQSIHTESLPYDELYKLSHCSNQKSSESRVQL